MRIALGLSVVALSTAACASGARPVASAPTPEPRPMAVGRAAAPAPAYAPGAYATPAHAAATGPVDARTLASRNGLAFRDSGDGVLLESADLRARFYSGSDRMTIDGRTQPMGEAAVRRDGALIVPASGARLVDRAMADARDRRSKHARTLAERSRPLTPPLVLPVPAAPAPVEPAVMPVKGGLAGPGEPGWVPTTTERRWQWIVIHHSDDTSGCASKYHRVHLDKGWENGLGYNFVIGNGTMSADGEVEVGDRWRQQIQGAHAKTDDNRYNEFGVGIVLVGDFTAGGPTRRQYDACVRLTRWLMARYRITPDRVLRHSDCKPTCCPGPGFPWERFIADVSVGA